MDRKRVFGYVAGINAVAGIIYSILLCMFWVLPLCSNVSGKAIVGMAFAFGVGFVAIQLLNLLYLKLSKADIRIMATFNFFLVFLLFKGDSSSLTIFTGYSAINFLTILFVFRKRR